MDVREEIARTLAWQTLGDSEDKQWSSKEKVWEWVVYSKYVTEYLEKADQILAIDRIAVLAEDQSPMDIPDPDPHIYEGEFEAICATKMAAFLDGWRRVDK